MPNRGEIWIADLGVKAGTEPGKRRPVLVLQSQALIEAGHESTLIAPLTSRVVPEAEPIQIRVPAQDNLEKDSAVMLDQIRSIDNARFVSGPIARLEAPVLTSIRDALIQLFDLEGTPARPDQLS